MLKVEEAITELERRHSSLDEAIAALEVIETNRRSAPAPELPHKAGRPAGAARVLDNVRAMPKRQMSTDTRERMSAAMKARWHQAHRAGRRTLQRAAGSVR